MKKVVTINENLKVLMSVDLIKAISSESAKEEELMLLKLMGNYKNGAELRTGDLSELLPNTKVGNALKYLWNYNCNYSFGTKKQMDILKENNLYNDRGVIFGNKPLINPMPDDVETIIKDLFK